MGFESYNFELHLVDKLRVHQISCFFSKMDYSIRDNDTLEKAIKYGFIEVQFNQRHVSLRTAKANDADIIVEIFKDIGSLRKFAQIDVFDNQLKRKISPSCIEEVLSNFTRLKEEFQKYYPHVKHPIRCDAVFNNNATVS